MSDDRSAVTGARKIKATTCACFCCDRVEGTRMRGPRGTLVPSLQTDESGGAPSRTMTEEEWLDRLDRAVTELAAVASSFGANRAPNN